MYVFEWTRSPTSKSFQLSQQKLNLKVNLLKHSKFTRNLGTLIVFPNYATPIQAHLLCSYIAKFSLEAHKSLNFTQSQSTSLPLHTRVHTHMRLCLFGLSSKSCFLRDIFALVIFLNFWHQVPVNVTAWNAYMESYFRLFHTNSLIHRKCPCNLSFSIHTATSPALELERCSRIAIKSDNQGVFFIV